MRILETRISDLLLLEPRRYRDHRGYFVETWNQQRYEEAGLPARFVQDNLSSSYQGVLRGLHYQQPRAQGKLVSVLAGEVYDVAVDIRRGSPTFGEWFGVTLSEENGLQLYIPPGFAHGFVVTSEQALFSYKCTDYYAPGCERAVAWNDPDLGIAWPVTVPLVSDKDAAAPRLRDVPEDVLPALEVESVS